MLPQGQHGTLLVSEEMIVVSNPGPSLNFSSACAPTIVLSMMRQADAEAILSLQNHRLNEPFVFINYLTSSNLVTRTQSYKRQHVCFLPCSGHHSDVRRAGTLFICTLVSG